jgi:hypothetical protein
LVVIKTFGYNFENICVGNTGYRLGLEEFLNTRLDMTKNVAKIDGIYSSVGKHKLKQEAQGSHCSPESYWLIYPIKTHAKLLFFIVAPTAPGP